jgi:hypothetical protein
MITKNRSTHVRTALTVLVSLAFINLMAFAAAQWFDAGPLSGAEPVASVPLQFDPLTNTVTVSPSGGDDTLRLLAAIELCAAVGPRCAVRLTVGTVVTTPLAVAGLHGVVTFFGDAVMIAQLATETARQPSAIHRGHNAEGPCLRR